MINVQDLLDYGFTKTDIALCPFEKHLSEPDENGFRISIELTLERNTAEFALKLPDASRLFLQVENLEQLKVFENSIQSWEPDY